MAGVRYEVAADEGFRQIVRRGAIAARPDEAYTVHAEISGLAPATPYWYRFKWGQTESRIGRTRTAPAPGSTDPLRFAFVSCQNYTNGFYWAYRDLATQDVDVVVHLGDYIYEGPGDPANSRLHLPARELFSLEDYRTRHGQYRTDPDLQDAHASFPFVMTWDDHELKDNYADLAINSTAPLQTPEQRRAAAYLAYWEHAPLDRARKPVGKDMSLFRRIPWGALATFHVLDTRQYRSDQIALCTQAQRDPASGSYCPDALLETRGILGTAQRDWLFEGLAAPGAAWNVLANQVGFAPMDTDLRPGRRVQSRDNWDGYVADRQRVLDFLAANDLANTVVITGDAHEHAVRNVPPDFRSFDGDPVATEFVGTSITSEGFTDVPPTFGGNPENPHELFNDHSRGYVSVTLSPERWSAAFRGVSDVTEPYAGTSTIATYVVENGKPGGVRDGV